MASGKVLDKLRQLYAKVDADVKRWNSLEEQALSLIGTITNVISRLPALEDAGSYGTLAALPNLPSLLLAKQLAALDDLILQLQGCMDDMQGVVDDMARQSQQAQRFVKQERSLTPAVCAVTAGPIPSVAQCLQWLEEISHMQSQELRLKRALVQEVRYDTSEGDMREVAKLFSAQIHIDEGRVRDLLYIVAATQERRRF